MRCGVITRKLGMSRVFNDNDEHVPVTILRLENVEVLSIKSIEKDGYTAVQLGFCDKKAKNVTKPLRGFFAKAKVNPKEKIAEFKKKNGGQKYPYVSRKSFVFFLNF